MEAKFLTGLAVEQACQRIHHLKRAELLKWGAENSVTLTFEELDAFLSSLPETFHTTGVESTTMSLCKEDETTCKRVMLPIFCIHGQEAKLVMKVIVGPKSASVLLVSLCPHQHWMRSNEQIGRRLLFKWAPGGANDEFISALASWAAKQPFGTEQPTEFFTHYWNHVMALRAEKRIKNDCKALEDIIRKIPGDFYVVSVASGDRTKLRIPMQHGREELRLLTWVSPNVVKLMSIAQYIELDATFRSCKPYVAICVQAVFANVGMPVALTLAPSETADAYSFAYLCLQQVLRDSGRADLAENLLRLPMLSDMGSALSAFANQFALTQYWCHRHLIERFGAAGLLTETFRSLLSTTTKSQADDIFLAFKKECQALVESDKARAGSLSLALRKMHNLMNEYNKWGLEAKIASGHAFVARTTNHAESFHRHMNACTSTKRKPVTRLLAVLRLIMKRYKNLFESAQQNAKRKFDHLRQQAEIRIQHGEAEESFRREVCTCRRRIVYQAIFQVDFPCICNIMSFPQCPEIPDRFQLAELAQLPGVLHCPVPEHLTAHLPKTWIFQKRVDRNFRVSLDKGLENFALNLKIRPWLIALRNELKRRCHLSKDDASWKLLNYFWTQNVHLDKLTHKDMVIHELRLTQYAAGGTLHPIDGSDLLRLRYEIERPTIDRPFQITEEN